MSQISTSAQRKRKQREKLALLDISVVEVKLSSSERAMLDQGCASRGGARGAYDRDEYISTLIRNDNKKLNVQLSRLKPCGKCGQLSPGCGGLFKGDADCYHSHNAKKLML